MFSGKKTHPAVARAAGLARPTPRWGGSHCERLEPRRLLAAVTGSEFDPDDHEYPIHFTFDSDVWASVDNADITLTNLSDGMQAAHSQLDLAWDAATRTLKIDTDELVFRNPSAPDAYLADGNYEVVLRGTGTDGIFSDPADPLGSGLQGDHVFNFHFFIGDVTGDRKVDEADQAVIASSRSDSSGDAVEGSYAEGDVTGDGYVTEEDEAAVDGTYQSELPESPERTLGEITAGRATASTVQISWTVPNAPHDGFEVLRGTGAFDLEVVAELRNDDVKTDNDYQVANSRTGSTASWWDVGLNDGTEYWYRVRSFTDGGGAGPATDVAPVATLLPAPANARHTALPGGDAWLRWERGSNHHTQFLVERSLDAGETWSQVAAVGPRDEQLLLAAQPDGALYRMASQNVGTSGAITITSSWAESGESGVIDVPNVPEGASRGANRLVLNEDYLRHYDVGIYGYRRTGDPESSAPVSGTLDDRFACEWVIATSWGLASLTALEGTVTAAGSDHEFDYWNSFGGGSSYHIGTYNDLRRWIPNFDARWEILDALPALGEDITSGRFNAACTTFGPSAGGIWPYDGPRYLSYGADSTPAGATFADRRTIAIPGGGEVVRPFFPRPGDNLPNFPDYSSKLIVLEEAPTGGYPTNDDYDDYWWLVYADVQQINQLGLVVQSPQEVGKHSGYDELRVMPEADGTVTLDVSAFAANSAEWTTRHRENTHWELADPASDRVYASGTFADRFVTLGLDDVQHGDEFVLQAGFDFRANGVFELDEIQATRLIRATTVVEPTDVTAVALSPHVVHISWPPVQEGIAADSYRLERREAGDGNAWAEVVTLAGNDRLRHADNGLVDGTRYEYRVLTIAGGVESPPANASVTTPLAAPTNLAAAVNGAGQNATVTLTWQDNSASEERHRIQRMEVGSATTPTGPGGTITPGGPIDPGPLASYFGGPIWRTIGYADANEETFTDFGDADDFDEALSYSYRVVAENSFTVGDSDYSNIVTIGVGDMPAVPVPGRIYPVELDDPEGAGGVKLEWSKVSNATGYRVYRQPVGTINGPWEFRGPAGAADAPEFVDALARADQYRYIYAVAATNAYGESEKAKFSWIGSYNDPEADPDGDGLSTFMEELYGTWPEYFDTDRDLLSDGWEVEWGLDPLDDDEDGNGWVDTADDFDGDGMDNLTESIFNTDPYSDDTDGDGVSDAEEAANGSDPTDDSDGGIPPADDMKGKFRLTVGDHSGSHSERWALEVGKIKHVSRKYGEVDHGDYWYKLGRDYRIQLHHVGTKPSHTGGADYDWTAAISPTPEEESVPQYFITYPEGNEFEFLGQHDPSEENPSKGEWGTLHLPIVDLDVDSDNKDGFVEPADNRLEDRLELDPTKGKHVWATSGDLDDDGVPDYADFENGIGGGNFVPLVVRLSDNIAKADPTQLRIQFRYTGSDPDGLTSGSGTGSDPFVYAEPNPGVLRLWKEDAAGPRDVEGDYIEPEFWYYAEDLNIANLNGTDTSFDDITFFVEAVRGGDVQSIEVVVAVTGNKWSGQLDDTIHVRPLGVDLDTDSDNSGEIENDGGIADDFIEDDESLPGKIIKVADGDADLDGVPDFADFEWYTPSGGDASEPIKLSHLVPVHLYLPEATASADTRFRFAYDASDPQGVVLTGAGTAADPHEYELPDGTLRLWTTDTADRNPLPVSQGGDFLPSTEDWLSVSTLANATVVDGTYHFWAEAVAASTSLADIEVEVEAEHDDQPNAQFSDKILATAYTTRWVAIDANDQVIENSDVTVSTSSPQVRDPSVVIQNLSPSDDEQEILGSIQVSGRVTDPSLNFIAGEDGRIGTLDVFLNGGEVPIGDIPVAATKSDEGTLATTHRFEGVFNGTIEDVELQPGENHVRLVARNKLGFSGSSNHSAAVEISLPPEVVEVFAPHDIPDHGVVTPPDVLNIRMQGSGSIDPQTTFVFKRRPGLYQPTGNSADFFMYTSDDFAGTEGTRLFFAPTNGATQAVMSGMYVDIAAYRIQNQYVELGWANSSAVAGLLIDPASINGFGNVKIVEKIPEFLEHSGELDDIHPHSLKVVGPNDQRFFSRVRIGLGGEVYRVVRHQNTLLISDADDDDPNPQPKLFGAYAGAGEVDGDFEGPDPSASGDFGDGFLDGFISTGTSIYDDAKAVVDLVHRNSILSQEGRDRSRRFANSVLHFALDPDERHRQIANAVSFTTTTLSTANKTAEAAAAILEDTDEIVDILLGNDERLLELNNETLLAVQFAAEVVDVIQDEIVEALDTPYEKGWWSGRIGGEILLEVGLALGTGGAGNAAKWALKSATLAKLATRLPDANVLGRVAAKVADLAQALTTTRMCFVAGTLVHTANGLVPIEDVRPGTLVLARDERTGEQAYKPVLETFATRPDALYTLSYDPDGDGPLAADAIVTTAPHPFWVDNRDADGDGTPGGFAAASELLAGDVLLTADGTLGEVLGLKVQWAEAGERFETYNFAVADFATYFVDEAGVWVHNAGGTECERIFSVYSRVTAKYTPDDPVAGYKYVRDRLPRMTDAAHRGFTDDVLKEIRENQDKLPARWQQLGVDPATDQFREAEVFAGMRFETKTGKTLRKPDSSRGESGDFVDSAGIQWDVKGPIPSQGNFDGFLSSLKTHMTQHPNGDERMLIDVSGFDTMQVKQVKGVVASYNSNYLMIMED